MTPEGIIKIVATHAGIKIKVLLTSSVTNVIEWRSLAMWLARTEGGFSYLELGKAFGRDHSTIHYAVEKIQRQIKERPGVASKAKLLKARLAAEPKGERLECPHCGQELHGSAHAELASLRGQLELIGARLNEIEVAQ